MKLKPKKQGVKRSSVDLYMSDMSKIPLFSLEEEIEAFKSYEKVEDDLVFELLSYTPVSIPIISKSIEKWENKEVDHKFIRSCKNNLHNIKRGRVEDSLNNLVSIFRDNFMSETIRSQLMDRIFSEKNSFLSKKESMWIEGLGPYLKKWSYRRNFIVTANLRLVVVFANRYVKSCKSLSVSDLIQEGNAGLLRATEKFNWRREVRFSTYASWWIRQSMRRALSDKDKTIRIPVHMMDSIYKVLRAEKEHYTKTGETISDEKIEEETGLSKRKFDQIQSSRENAIISLDTPIHSDDIDSPTLAQAIEDPNSLNPNKELQTKELRHTINEMLSVLSPIESKIIKWRYSIGNTPGLTLREIGSRFNLSRERIRQLEYRAIQKLKKRSRALSEFMAD